MNTRKTCTKSEDCRKMDSFQLSDLAFTESELEPRFLFFNLSSTLTTSEAIFVTLSIALGIATVAGLFYYLTYYIFQYGRYGYSTGSLSKMFTYASDRNRLENDDPESKRRFRTSIKSIDGLDFKVPIRSPKENKDYYEKLQMCISLATALGSDEAKRSSLLMECYKSIPKE